MSEERKDEEMRGDGEEENKCEFSTRRLKRVNADTVNRTFDRYPPRSRMGKRMRMEWSFWWRNAIEEMSGNEASMASHKMCSYVVEMLLRAASDDQLLVCGFVYWILSSSSVHESIRISCHRVVVCSFCRYSIR